MKLFSKEEEAEILALIAAQSGKKHTENYSKLEVKVDIDCPSFDIDWSEEIHAKYKLRKDYFLTPVFTHGPNNQLRGFRESIILGLIQRK